MSSFNKVILMGNLTRKPEVRYTQGGIAICNAGLAVNRRFKDSQTGDWREEATFIDVTIFGKRGEAFARFHEKGKPAFVEGHLRLDTWEDKQSGQKRSKLYVVGENWEFVGGGREGGGGFSPTEDAPAGAQAGGYGEYGGGGSDAGGSGAAASAGSGGGDFLDADDAPF